MNKSTEAQVAIIGAGFSGLSAGYELAKNGIKPIVLESSSTAGGMAQAFEVGGSQLDQFYHHWFTNDEQAMDLIGELGLNDRLLIQPTRTGIYYSGSTYRLSTPFDLLKFTPLSFADRIRLGVLTLKARRVSDWMELEDITARDWLLKNGGAGPYKVVWEPLLKGKFGPVAEDISAVWIWNKLKLRGGSRGKRGE